MYSTSRPCFLEGLLKINIWGSILFSMYRRSLGRRDQSIPSFVTHTSVVQEPLAVSLLITWMVLNFIDSKNASFPSASYQLFKGLRVTFVAFANLHSVLHWPLIPSLPPFVSSMSDDALLGGGEMTPFALECEPLLMLHDWWRFWRNSPCLRRIQSFLPFRNSPLP